MYFTYQFDTERFKWAFKSNYRGGYGIAPILIFQADKMDEAFYKLKGELCEYGILAEKFGEVFVEKEQPLILYKQKFFSLQDYVANVKPSFQKKFIVFWQNGFITVKQPRLPCLYYEQETGSLVKNVKIVGFKNLT